MPIKFFLLNCFFVMNRGRIVFRCGGQRRLKGSYLVLFLPVVLSFFASQKSAAQSQITFRQLSVKNGLSQNSAISITQDSIGYLWIATQDGLNKYDGRKFISYPYNFADITKPDYSNLGKAYTDRQGGLWIIPMDRIPRKLNEITDKFEPISNVSDASAIFQDTELNIWIGTYSEGLYLLKHDSQVAEQIISSSEIPRTIFDIAQNNTGKLFFTTEKEIVAYDPIQKQIEHIKPKKENETKIEQNFSALVFDSDGKQWTGTYGDGLYFKNVDDPRFRRIAELSPVGELPEDLNIIDLKIDKKGRLWVASYGNGLYLIDFAQKRISHFSAEKYNPKALHYNDILCVYEDYSGTLWFGTDGAGVSYYDEYLEKFNSLTNFQTPDDISIDVVRALTVDNQNKVWIGTSGKGLTQYDPISQNWRTFTEDSTKNSIASDRVMSLMADSKDRIWIGTQEGGLSILNTKGDFRKFTPSSNPPLSANTIWCIHKDFKNRIWLGTREQGIIQFDSEKGEIRKYLSDNDGLPSNNIRAIAEDGSGNLWVGTETNGIVFFDIEENKFESYQESGEKNSLINNNIKSLYHASNGILWIGTNGGGLNALDINEKKFYSFTVEDGLPNNVIYGILPDAAGNLWLSSNKGITKFTPGVTIEDEPEVTNYTNYAGLATEFNTGAYHKGSDGTLYFGGLDGFYWFKPDEIKENKVLPKTTITGFEVLNEPRPMNGDISLAHNQNTISFTFSSLHYSLPEKNAYKYRLVNYDEDWVQAGNSNFARYTQLPPGAYTFQVKSSNYDGVWNEFPESFDFIIAPPWYLTSYAKIIYTLLLLTAILGVYRYFTWRWRMQLNLRLKEEEAERLQKLNDFKSGLYTDIAHEFKTPLTLISGPIDQKLSQGSLSDFDHANFSIIKRNTHRLTSLVDQLLELAKLEDGKLKLQIEKGNLSLFVHTIAQSFEYQAYVKDIDYSVEIDSLGDVWYDEDTVEKITTNLLSNAFKYTPREGVCKFSITKGEQLAIINIRNTVVNASKLELNKLFTRFYQQDEYSEGMGVGLSLVQELVKFYGGTIVVRIEGEDIIHFEVKLPNQRSAFPEASIKETFENADTSAPQANIIDIDCPFSEDLLEQKPVLLVVEDHQEVRTFIKLALQPKFRILEAENGQIGLEIALSQIPDVILSDIRMPIKNGIELCNTLKTDERTSHIPVILLTASVGEEDELKGLTSGADDFVRKPFKIGVLEKRIGNLVAIRRLLRERYSQELILKPKDISITPGDEIFLDKIQRILDEHLSDSQFNSEAFSKMAKMSRMQLHRKLLAYTGLSTSAFIRSQRLKQAAQLLKTSNLTINEVAYTVGFNTPSYFMTCFKERFKMTPSEFTSLKGHDIT